ncbi:carbohydrate ABC transporter permease [Corynebacterium mendelii]|uniref:Sugar ABC transporter permease n=1 Tax=Corynebacterium mendelii TaxID=2765362 RepID=A0A939DZA9_9CORY|nr:sugar ABC transporter permease [Corynebacterium mendelii]MBN9644005.1 sugar ABC transporter permease [Corynebacterium mendelii]
MERKKKTKGYAGFFYVLPSFAILMLIAIVPIIYTAVLSFSDYDLFGAPEFIGTENYKELFSDKSFVDAVKNTVIFTAIAVPLQTVIALLLADVLARTNNDVLSKFVRSVLFIPVVASLVLVGTVWQYMLASNGGTVNELLDMVGIPPVNFLGDHTNALISVSLVSAWKHIGYFLVIYYAGVKEIPHERYEAALVDGAGRFQQFIHITLPGLRPITFLVVILGTIWSFQVFDLVYAMTGGGPAGATTTIVIEIFEQGFQTLRFGYASAIAMVLFAAVALVSIVQQKFYSRLED